MTGEGQLELPVGPYRNGGLFSERFLSELLPEWPEFGDADHRPLLEELQELFAAERIGLATANEAQTEEHWIQPVLAALGFHYTVQAGMRVGAGRRQPDYALFLTEADRRDADPLEGAARYESAVCVADAKRFDRPLERRRAERALSEDPVAQIIHYVSVTRRPWGLLTNGRHWRMYGLERDLLGGAFYEVDLVRLLEAGDARAFRWFSVLFSASAFEPGPDGRSLLDRALGESRASAVAVGDALEEQVFDAVPRIAAGLLGDGERDAPALAAAFDHSLVLLYRLLFCLYAEARGLLPVENRHYFEYSLRKQKEGVAADLAGGRRFSSQSDDLYNDLRALFRIVDRGDESIGVAEYNGGLFSARRHPYFEGRTVPDDALAPALDGLYRVGGEFVDYRDLSVRHLGTIYERLLDYQLADDGELTLVATSGRHETGSYFTPELVVDRIVERTLEPALAARSEALGAVDLQADDVLDAFLDVKVLDPAMGSGHFLVAAAAWIAQYIATDPLYDGDLSLDEIQRRVAERCLYGVDANPMAVELAQLSLWLATARVGQPLTFLANLRVGNSLVGAKLEELLAGEETLFAERLARDAEAILERLDTIAERGSDAGEDVHEKERLAEAAQALREPLERHADEEVAPHFTETGLAPLHWALEFPDVFLAPDGRPLGGGGFDAVIGNPPYVRIQETGRELAAWCRRRFQTASGSFDTYVPFIEQGVALLGPSGRLGFIVPSRFLKADYGRRLREWLTQNRLVEEIVDFGDAQLFPGATNYTCITVLRRHGGNELTYRRVGRGADDLRRALASLDTAPGASFSVTELGQDPWVLATGEEAELLRALRGGSERLDSVTTQIFQGLVTSADPIYVVEDRGQRGDRRIVYSRASDRELELEPDLLHQLASGIDVERHAFRPLRSLVLFPYRHDGDEMRLLRDDELAALPRTAAYFAEHEPVLRGRERRRMDRDGWYGYVYPKNLGAHDLPKLGVAATVQHLEVAPDPGGEVYFHNVRVNGILERDGGPSIWLLGVLLNSRPLDWVFRRMSIPHANGYFAANKQFIAPLPIRIPGAQAGGELETLGRRIHDRAAAILGERRGFLDWLEGELGLRTTELDGSTAVARYDELTLDELLALLRRNRRRIGPEVEGRAFRERLTAEHAESVDRIAGLRATLDRDEDTAEAAVEELYELTAAQQELIARDYA
ncbi:MAG: N-6 DNA methylase [Thermoleophilaceae bacterium]